MKKYIFSKLSTLLEASVSNLSCTIHNLLCSTETSLFRARVFTAPNKLCERCWALRQSNMDTNEGRCDLHYSDCTPLTLNLIVEYVWRVIVHSPRTSAESDEASKNSSEAGYRV